MVQNQAKKHGLVVEKDLVPLEVDLSQPGVAAHAVDDSIPVQQFELDVVQIRIGRAPGTRLIDGSDQGDSARGRRFDAAAVSEGRPKAQPASRIAQDRGEQEPGAVKVRRDAHALEMPRRPRFEPNGLPDAGDARVLAAAGVLVSLALLARGLMTRADVVLGQHDEIIRPVAQRIGDIEMKRRASAVMAADTRAVDPDAGGVVDRAEVEEDPARAPVPRLEERSVVPDGGHEVAVFDSGQAALGRVRHADPPIEGGEVGVPFALDSRAPRVDCEAPLAVEIDPLLALELRLGMLRARDLLGDKRREREEDRGGSHGFRT